MPTGPERKAIFFGTPAISVRYLELLAARRQVVAVLSQPDKAAGRGLQVGPTPVKKRALELGLKVLQPEKSSLIAQALAGCGAELAVAVAYGKILKPDALAVPRLGTLNVHFSLLPKYRGAAPVQWSLARGETRTGVTIFWLDEGMDTGPVFLRKETDVWPEENAPALLERLAELGVEALGEALDQIAAGNIVRLPQTGETCAAPLIVKDDARIDLSRPARDIHNLVRGFRGWPQAWLKLGKSRLKVLKTTVAGETGAGQPGTVLRIERGGGFLIQCHGSSRLWFLEVQPEGKKPVAAADFLNGLRLAVGDRLPIDQ